MFTNPRHERKYWFELGVADVFIDKLNSLPFHQTYPPRKVHSIYLDTPDFNCYYQSINGAYQRYKLRLRWYGVNDKASAQLEVKRKKGELGAKQVYLLGKIDFSKITSVKKLHQQIVKTALAKKLSFAVIKLLQHHSPVLKTTYTRKYWQHDLLPVRLTIDTDFSTSNIYFSDNMKVKPVDHQLEIVELKYAPGLENDHLASQVGQLFPLQLNQFSKYSRGF